MHRWTGLAAAAVAATAAWTTASAHPATAIALAADPLAPQSSVRPADLVLRNGKIVTVDETQPEAQAVAVNGDTIAAIGSNQEIQAYIGPATQRHRSARRARHARASSTRTCTSPASATPPRT